MQIKKTELAKIIREEIARAVNEAEYRAPSFEKRRDNALYYAYASPQMAVYPEKVADLFDMALDKAIEAGGISSETEESRDVFIDIEDEIKKAEGVGRENIAKVLMALNTLDGMSVEQLKAIPRSAEAAKAAEERAQPEIERKRAVQAKRSMRDIMGKLDEEEIQAARYKHAHLPGNDKEGQFGKVQQLEEVGMISTFMDPAMFASLSPAAQAILAILDPFLTVSGVGLVSAALMAYLRGPNKQMPSAAKLSDAEAQMLMQAFQKVEREIGADKVDQPGERKAVLDTLRQTMGARRGEEKEEPEVDAGIPADELGAKR